MRGPCHSGQSNVTCLLNSRGATKEISPGCQPWVIEPDLNQKAPYGRKRTHFFRPAGAHYSLRPHQSPGFTRGYRLLPIPGLYSRWSQPSFDLRATLRTHARHVARQVVRTTNAQAAFTPTPMSHRRTRSTHVHCALFTPTALNRQGKDRIPRVRRPKCP